MNKLLTSFNGGFPYFLDDIRFSTDAIIDVIDNFLADYEITTPTSATSPNFIISGCVVTGTTTKNITAGYIYLNGEVLKVDAQSVTGGAPYVYTKATTYDSAGDRAMKNTGITVQPYQKNRGVAASGAITATNLDIEGDRLSDKIATALSGYLTANYAYITGTVTTGQVVLGAASNTITSQAINTAFNKNFGTGTANVPQIGTTLGNSLILETDGTGKLVTVSKNTAYNKSFGTGTANVPQIGATLGNTQTVETDGTGKLITAAKNTAYNKAFGTGTSNVPEIGATLGNSQTVETNASGKLITAAKGTAYNKSFGTGTTNIVEIGATISGDSAAHFDSDGKLIEYSLIADSGFSTNSTSFGTVQYQRHNGLVFIYISGTTTSTSEGIGTLAIGHRPEIALNQRVVDSNGDVALVAIATNGVMTLNSAASGRAIDHSMVILQYA